MQKNLSFQNKNLRYHVRGQGQPVMLVHGFGEDHRVWDFQTPQLEQRFQLILPDLPGSGASELNDDVSMENMAEALRAILHQENIDSVVMLGHSMGGYVMLAFAEKYAALLSAMGMVHSTAVADTEEKKQNRRKGIDFMKSHGVPEFMKASTPNLFSDHTKEHNPGLINALINQYSDMKAEALTAYYEAMMQRPDRKEVLKNFTRPLLFIGGAHDNTVPYEQVVQQSRLALVSYLHTLHLSGHMGMWEEPNETSFILEEFIKNNVL